MTPANHLWTATVLVLAVSGTTGGALIDQHYVPAMTNSHGIVGASQQVHTAQTFTVGADGVLVGFDMWVTHHENVSEPLLFDIRKTQSGAPVDADSSPDILARGVLPSDVIAFSRPFDPPPGAAGAGAPVVHVWSKSATRCKTFVKVDSPASRADSSAAARHRPATMNSRRGEPPRPVGAIPGASCAVDSRLATLNGGGS